MTQASLAKFLLGNAVTLSLSVKKMGRMLLSFPLFHEAGQMQKGKQGKGKRGFF